jgi:hypothetical protein
MKKQIVHFFVMAIAVLFFTISSTTYINAQVNKEDPPTYPFPPPPPPPTK